MKPLFPKAISLWLIDNTSLTFQQIADFCHLHVLEVEKIANSSNIGIHSISPIESGETTIQDIRASEKDSKLPLVYHENTDYKSYVDKISKQSTKQSKFKRKNKPEAILWLINQYPELSNYQITKLLNTTTNTIKAIRSRTYWNYKNLSPKNPVTLDLCSEEDLTNVLNKLRKSEESSEAQEQQ